MNAASERREDCKNKSHTSDVQRATRVSHCGFARYNTMFKVYIDWAVRQCVACSRGGVSTPTTTAAAVRGVRAGAGQSTSCSSYIRSNIYSDVPWYILLYYSSCRSVDARIILKTKAQDEERRYKQINLKKSYWYSTRYHIQVYK